MHDVNPLTWLLQRDRMVVVVVLATAVAMSWIYLWVEAGMDMSTMAGEATPIVLTPWSPTDAIVAMGMWAAMMLAMMLPSATPTILLYATISRRRSELGAPHVSAVIFALGYGLVWAGFSVGATGFQWALEHTALLSPTMASASMLLGGLLLLSAGLYQLTPLKTICLQQCRSPLDFVLRHWREGRSGALCMGLTHGLYCLGCCWALMGLLFVGGIMNLTWIAAIAALVLLEKVLPGGIWVSRGAGIVLIVWGCLTLSSVELLEVEQFLLQHDLPILFDS